ncbi:MAG: MBL fold metallo-hydrolase [Burkholderiales bacterium]|nr:MBL fold metallo-hydrolase [Burkholderiales bacterium]
MKPQIEAFYDSVTGTVTYVLFDEPNGHAAVIDPVLDYDAKSGRTRTGNADKALEFIRTRNLTLDWILETHAHADHLSAANYFKQQLGGKIAIGDRIGQVQRTFKKLFNLGEDLQADGSQFDHLFADGETFSFGKLSGKALLVPGHTPADIAYQVDDAVFVGDTLFMPDVGTARCDFPGGDARTLYGSIQRLFTLPSDTRLFMCHDYPPDGRAPLWETTVAEQRKFNIHIHDGIGEDDFVAMRKARDATLEVPILILPSVQVNIRAGAMPPPESNGVSYLRIPLNRL